jgi:hypothetical protein
MCRNTPKCSNCGIEIKGNDVVIHKNEISRKKGYDRDKSLLK